MTNTSDRPISVDGVRLDTLAWNIQKINRAVASRRDASYTVPNMDGAVPTLNDPLEPASFGLDMWLRGTDANGAVPGAGARDTFRANLDELLHLFGKRYDFLEVTEQVNATETRRALCKVVDQIAPDVNEVGAAGTFTVGLTIPSGLWEDLTTTDWSGTLGAASGTVQAVSSLQGATERISDAIYLVTGPANSPSIQDPNTGMTVTLAQNLSSTQLWRFNSATWASRYGTGLTLASTDTTGTDGTASTDVTGPSRGYGLPLAPIRSGGNRVVQVKLSGTSFTAATRLSIRARRKYAA